MKPILAHSAGHRPAPSASTVKCRATKRTKPVVLTGFVCSDYLLEKKALNDEGKSGRMGESLYSINMVSFSI
ncbi:MAG: hypothetical protein DPW09_03035 [Anaerolineae bacterium]|nr:hypothetical protein [Anaerolineae bacterium]